MLQRGSTVHPSSQGSSPNETPKDPRWELPAPPQHSDQLKEAVETEPQSSGGSPIPVPEEGEQLQQPVARTFGVYNILNPSDHRGASSTEQRIIDPRAENEGDTAVMQGSPHYHHTESPSTGTKRQNVEEQTLERGNISLPPIAGSSNPSPSTDRPSPTLAPHYSMGGVRRILTPRSPLTRALSHSSVPLSTTKGRHGYGAHTGSQLAAQHYDDSPPPGSIIDRPSESAFFPASSMPPHPALRSLSQPGLGFQTPDTQNAGLPSLDWSRRSTALAAATGYGGSPSPGGVGSLTGGAPGAVSGEQWSSGPARLGQGNTGGITVGDTQQYITITPTHGEEIRVPVDIHQASRQADEKRLRNAGASARFRARKKEKDKEVQVGMQRLESQNRELQKRLQEAEAERDFYRNERNRLRHIMYREPGLREAAESGPPSPTSTARSGGSFIAEHSPMPALPPQQPSVPAPSYFNEPPNVEPPARRRRTDPAPGIEFSTPAYGSPGSTPLPPIPVPTFVPASGLPLTSPSGQRLPPLRGLGSSQALAGPDSGPPPPPSLPVGTQPAQLAPYGRRPYDSHWQAGPRYPHDQGQR
ncbi:uncharacterized protein E0L32_001006 [Thyridium curvatum]|uniref:BZIP domain-containing protein n=1 Tax=Thyridium curvatum TaxID=1093900 RepID=A0A507B2Q6_9PEZI|nr:uncharacterized protein E0L32_001006 [Thyridium curvatum]TPX11188.1 hypothetical protein E0L32_001006 [Thyridium curvatum]